jgi:hypothetical protein
LSIDEKNSCKRWERRVKDEYTDVDTSLLYLPMRYHFKNAGVCGDAGILDIVYEYFPTTLKKEVQWRSLTGSKFSEYDIWKLVYCLLGAANSLHTNNKKLDKVSLDNVFMNE